PSGRRKAAFDAVGEVPSGSTRCNAQEHLRPQTISCDNSARGAPVEAALAFSPLSRHHRASSIWGGERMNIGFVGRGAMGSGIVPRLMAAGHAVTGWNRSKEKAESLIKAGMRFATTPRAAAAGADIVFSIVTDAPAVRSVALGTD